MSFVAFEPKIGLMLAGIGAALLLPEFTDAHRHEPGAMTVVAPLLGIVGTSFGMIDVWENGPSWSPHWEDPSWWPDAAWVFLGVLFGGAILSRVFYTTSVWWQAGLVALALAQVAAVTVPLLVSRRRTQPKRSSDADDEDRGGKAV
jgi:hypothetical protein